MFYNNNGKQTTTEIGTRGWDTVVMDLTIFAGAGWGRLYLCLERWARKVIECSELSMLLYRDMEYNVEKQR